MPVIGPSVDGENLMSIVHESPGETVTLQWEAIEKSPVAPDPARSGVAEVDVVLVTVIGSDTDSPTSTGPKSRLPGSIVKSPGADPAVSATTAGRRGRP